MKGPIGKYKIIKELGRGGMSRVYLVEDMVLKKKWAMKMVDKMGPDGHFYGKNLLEEARIMKDLDHPLLPKVLEIFNMDDKLCMIMEYVPGKSLEEIVTREGRLAEDDVKVKFMELADCMAYLHSLKNKVIYSDMKPSNIMMTEDGRLKLIDFSVARLGTGKEIFPANLYASSGYAPPEQYIGNKIDEKTDIYGLGMTMYRLASGLDPSSDDFIYKPLRDLRPEISKDLDKIIGLCIKEKPEERYGSIRALVKDLKKYDKKRERNKKYAKLAVISALSIAAIFSEFSGKREEKLLNAHLLNVDPTNIRVCEFIRENPIDLNGGKSTEKCLDMFLKRAVYEGEDPDLTGEKLRSEREAMFLIFNYLDKSIEREGRETSGGDELEKIKRLFTTDTLGKDLYFREAGPWGRAFINNFIEYFEYKEGVCLGKDL